MTIEERLERIESLLAVLLNQQTARDYYEIDAFASLVGKSPFTVREWARLGRIRAEKRNSGRGASTAWVVSHQEYQRYQREGLLPPRMPKS
jgi:hypothetical protein